MGIFGDRMRRVRMRRGLSQAALARQLGMPRQQINNYEKGRFDPNLEIATRLADALGVSLDVLTGRLPLSPEEEDEEPVVLVT